MDPVAVDDVSQVIQLVVAPVFLLAGIGAFINAFASRLGRIFDRIRQLERELATSTSTSAGAGAHAGADQEILIADLATLKRRIRLSYIGIALGTLSALFVCVLIAVAFAGHFFDFPFRELVAVLFMAAMLSLIGGLVMFLREITIAVRRLAGDRH